MRVNGRFIDFFSDAHPRAALEGPHMRWVPGDELGSRREPQGRPTERPGLLRACPVSPSAAVAAWRSSHCVHFHRLVWASEMGTKVPGHAPKVARIGLQGVPECPRTPGFGPPRHPGKSIFRPPGTLPGPSPCLPIRGDGPEPAENDF